MADLHDSPHFQFARILMNVAFREKMGKQCAILKKCKQTWGAIDPRVLNCIKESNDCKLVMHNDKNEIKFSNSNSFLQN